MHSLPNYQRLISYPLAISAVFMSLSSATHSLIIRKSFAIHLPSIRYSLTKHQLSISYSVVIHEVFMKGASAVHRLSIITHEMFMNYPLSAHWAINFFMSYLWTIHVSVVVQQQTSTHPCLHCWSAPNKHTPMSPLLMSTQAARTIS